MTGLIRIAMSAAALSAFAMHAYSAQENAGSPDKASASQTRPAQAALPWADGTVEEVDIESQYVILRHGPIANLHMEPMTMAFAVRDAAMLSLMKSGDKIRFTAENVGEVATIMSLQVKR